MTAEPPSPLDPGRLVEGPLFNEPMRVASAWLGRSGGLSDWSVFRNERFQSIILIQGDIQHLQAYSTAHTFAGDRAQLRLGLLAFTLGIAYEFDPCFGLSIFRVDPLPHQFEAVYRLPPETRPHPISSGRRCRRRQDIMTDLPLRELELWGLVERILMKERTSYGT